MVGRTRTQRSVRLVIVATLVVVAQPLMGNSPVAHAVVAPPARLYPGMATDPATGKVVMFGGRVDTREGTSSRNDTWIWNGTTWNKVQPPVKPPSRSRPLMVADPSTGTIVMFGGRDSSGSLADTWLWDGRTRSWEEASSTGPVVNSAELAYDTTSRTVLLIGHLLGGPEDDSHTWSWDGRDKTWSLLPTVDDHLPSRLEESLASDPVTGKVVLFGGELCHMCGGTNETWLRNGQSGAWAKVPTSVRPSPRYLAQMAPHVATGRILLFGGTDGWAAIKDTWLWDGATSTWSQQNPLKSPCQRYGAGMAYHPGTATTVMFGGRANACLLNDGSPGQTWVWSGTNWARKT